MPGARRIRAETDGGPLKGGAPRAVWLTLGTAPRAVSIQSAAQRLVSERRPCHLVWDAATGDIVQLISILRAGRALGAPEKLDWDPDRVPRSPGNVNTEGRICVQIGVLGHPAEPFTGGPLAGLGAIVGWLDSWSVPRSWPAGRPARWPWARNAAACSGRAAVTSGRRRFPAARTSAPARSTSTGSPGRTCSRSIRWNC